VQPKLHAQRGAVPTKTNLNRPFDNSIAKSFFVFKIQTPNVVFFSCDMHNPHIEFMLKCYDQTPDEATSEPRLDQVIEDAETPNL